MNRLREIDKRTHHLRGRIILSGDGDFPSATETFLRALEAKILESSKGFKHSGITLEFMSIVIK